MAVDVEDWAGKILDDHAFWAGHPLARDWQQQHGCLPIGSRLVPITPFVLGGEDQCSNLHVLDAVKGMKYRASIARQIEDLPDGARIHLVIEE